MTELCDIAFKYGTDKCPQIKHCFTEFYYELTKDMRMDVKKVFEVGIGLMEPTLKPGASLYMWREWFPNAQIYAIDVDEKLIFQDERITTFWCDQVDADGLRKIIREIGGDIDIFIDDGSHEPVHQVVTCLTTMPLMDNPLYFIEDVGYTAIQDWLLSYNTKYLRHSRRRWVDDQMLLVRR